MKKSLENNRAINLLGQSDSNWTVEIHVKHVAELRSQETDSKLLNSEDVQQRGRETLWRAPERDPQITHVTSLAKFFVSLPVVKSATYDVDQKKVQY